VCACHALIKATYLLTYLLTCIPPCIFVDVSCLLLKN